MFSSKTLFAGAFAAFALSTAASGQNLQTKNFSPVQGPLQRATYDIETGKVTRLGTPATQTTGVQQSNAQVIGTAAATANCFLNTSTMGYFSSGTTGFEWRDWAAKNTGKTGLITQFYFGYATALNDPSAPIAGVGVAMEVAFYTGETGFCTATGSEIEDARFLFTGLPGNGGTLGSNTGAGFTITAFVPSSTLFCANDGKLGWAYAFKDSPGAGFPGSGNFSGPLMTSFVTENTCAADAFDAYNRTPGSTGTCIASFFFGGCEPLPQPAAPVGTPCASFYIGLGEDDGSDVASTTLWNPTGCNPNSFATTAGPIIGSAWNHTITPVSQARVGYAISLAAQNAMSGSFCRNGAKPGNLNGTALYAFGPYLPGESAQLFQDDGTGMMPAGDPTNFTINLAKNAGNINARFCTQGFGVNFGPVASYGLNAEIINIGTN